MRFSILIHQLEFYKDPIPSSHQHVNIPTEPSPAFSVDSIDSPALPTSVRINVNVETNKNVETQNLEEDSSRNLADDEDEIELEHHIRQRKRMLVESIYGLPLTHLPMSLLMLWSLNSSVFLLTLCVSP